MQLNPEIVTFVGRLVDERKIHLQQTLNPEDDGAHGKFLEQRYVENPHGRCQADLPGVGEYKTHNQNGSSNLISLSKFSQPINKQGQNIGLQVENKFKYGLVLDEYILEGSIILRKKVTIFMNLTKDWKLYTVFRTKQKLDGHYTYSILKHKLGFMYENSEVCLDNA